MHFPPDERFEFVKLEVPSTWLSLESGGKWLGGKFYRAPGKSPSSKLGVLDKGGSAPGTKPLDDGGGKYSAKEKAAIMKREEEMKAKEMGGKPSSFASMSDKEFGEKGRALMAAGEIVDDGKKGKATTPEAEAYLKEYRARTDKMMGRITEATKRAKAENAKDILPGTKKTMQALSEAQDVRANSLNDIYSKNIGSANAFNGYMPLKEAKKRTPVGGTVRIASATPGRAKRRTGKTYDDYEITGYSKRKLDGKNAYIPLVRNVKSPEGKPEPLTKVMRERAGTFNSEIAVWLKTGDY
jgi:hypothetical protein